MSTASSPSRRASASRASPSRASPTRGAGRKRRRASSPSRAGTSTRASSRAASPARKKVTVQSPSRSSPRKAIVRKATSPRKARAGTRRAGSRGKMAENEFFCIRERKHVVVDEMEEIFITTKSGGVRRQMRAFCPSCNVELRKFVSMQ